MKRRLPSLPKRIWAATAVLSLAAPAPAFALRASVEGTQAGLEERLRPLYSAVEVRNPERVAALRLETVLWAFDDNLWSGYPHQAANRYFAERLGLNVRNPSVMKAFHEFIQSASGLPWDEVKARLQARGWALAEEIAGEGLMADVRNYADEVVAREVRTDPERYLIRVSRGLLSAFKEARIRQVILTGASAESRWRYAAELGIQPFFDEIHGEGRKEEMIERELEMRGGDPDRVVLIGDGPRDMVLARRAGIGAVAYAATPEARAAFLALPEDSRPDVIVNGTYEETDWILSTLGLPEPSRLARLRNYEHQFLEDLEHPRDPPRVYTLYISEVVKAKRWRRDEREHHAGVLLSLTPYGEPVGFLPIGNTFADSGRFSWIGRKVELLYRLQDTHHPVQVVVEREGKKSRTGRPDFIFRLVRPWTRLAVSRFRHQLARLSEPALLQALERGVSIPVSVRKEVPQQGLEALQWEVMEMIAELLRGSPHFSGRAYPFFELRLDDRVASTPPKLFVLEKGADSLTDGRAIALHGVLARILQGFLAAAQAVETAETIYEGVITLRMENAQGRLVLELEDSGPGIPMETLGQFLQDVLGDPPDQQLRAFGERLVYRYSGQIEVDTRHRQTGGYRLVHNPADGDVRLKAIQPGARHGIGTTVRWTVSLHGPSGEEDLNAGLEESASLLLRKMELLLKQRWMEPPLMPGEVQLRPLASEEVREMREDKGLRLVLSKALESVAPDWVKGFDRPVRVLELTFPAPVKSGWENSERVVAYYHLPEALPEGSRIPVVVIPSMVHLDSFARAASAWLPAQGIAVLEVSLPVHGPRSPPDLPDRVEQLLGRRLGLPAITTTERYSALELQPGDYKNLYLEAVAELSAAVSWLQERPEVDLRRIGVAGQSLTGMLAHLTYALDPRISRLISVAPVVSFGESFWNARGRRYDRLRGITSRLGWDPESFIPATAVLDLRNSPGRSTSGIGFLVTTKDDEVITDRQVQDLLVRMGVGGPSWESFIRWDLSVAEAISPHLELFLQNSGRILGQAADVMRSPPLDFLIEPAMSLGPVSMRAILRIAREVGADRAFAVPLDPAGSAPVTLSPFLYGPVEDRAAVEEYLAGAGSVLEKGGFRLAPLREGLPEPSDRPDLVIHEGDLPVPVQAATFQAAQVSAGHPARLDPLLVAARTLHPRLSWDFLKAYQPRVVLIVEDELSRTRYLVVLA